MRREHAIYPNVRSNTNREKALNERRCCKFVANIAIILNEKLSPMAFCQNTGYKYIVLSTTSQQHQWWGIRDESRWGGTNAADNF